MRLGPTRVCCVTNRSPATVTRLGHDGSVTDLTDLSAVEQAGVLRAGQVSARELLDAHLARVGELNPRLNAIVALDPEPARARAVAIDDDLASGRPVGPLAGLVTAHKDLIDTADFPTTYGSPLFAGHRPAVDNALVERLKLAGALAIGKTNTPEFGAGSHTHNPVYGVTRNPWDPERSCGGSSGGAAVGLATGMLALADGSDAGGSLRNPAGWNNVVGFRSSSRLSPAVGPGNAFLPYSVEGPMARTVDDLVLLLRVMSAPDRRDPLQRVLDHDVVAAAVDRPLRVAFSPSLGGLPVETDVASVLATVPGWVEGLGWSVAEDEPDFEGADECFETIRAWSFANGPLGSLGERLGGAKAVLGEEVARGRALGAGEVWAAMAHLSVLWRRGVRFFERHDLLLAPVSQVSPFPIDREWPTEVAGSPMGRYIEWMRSCSRITVMGLPTLSLPAGFTDDGLPVGVQVIGSPLGDASLLAAARMLEAARPQHQIRPPRSRGLGSGGSGELHSDVDHVGHGADGDQDQLGCGRDQRRASIGRSWCQGPTSTDDLEDSRIGLAGQAHRALGSDDLGRQPIERLAQSDQVPGFWIGDDGRDESIGRGRAGRGLDRRRALLHGRVPFPVRARVIQESTGRRVVGPQFTGHDALLGGDGHRIGSDGGQPSADLVDPPGCDEVDLVQHDDVGSPELANDEIADVRIGGSVLHGFGIDHHHHTSELRAVVPIGVGAES